MKIPRSWLPAIVIALLVLVECDAAFAGPKGSGKINPALAALYAEHAGHAAQQSGVPFASSNPLARVVNERVVIDAVADADVLALQAALSALGMQNVAVFGRVISGQLPISAIPALEGVHVRPPSVEMPTPPWNFSGSVRRHIFGRGRSCVPLKAPQASPRTSGSKAIQ